ncbi:peptidylprolyl isomerase [Candidatus Woesearchaeota archaeon]|nr:peptidylprolyl isomerase [Candidatus Woesearchaeota archaeon]
MKKKWVVLGLLVVAVLFMMYMRGSDTMTQKNRIVVFETTKGTIKIELFEDMMPITTKNFGDLVQKGFYDGTRFHRVIPRFMIQGGDPLTKDVNKKKMWGTGGPGYEIKDEFVKGLSNVRGTISMANHGPNTGGSQFFINEVDNTFLDGKHSVFGKVVEGMDVVDKIVNTPRDAQDRPLQDVVITTVKIISS